MSLILILVVFDSLFALFLTILYRKGKGLRSLFIFFGYFQIFLAIFSLIRLRTGLDPLVCLFLFSFIFTFAFFLQWLFLNEYLVPRKNGFFHDFASIPSLALEALNRRFCNYSFYGRFLKKIYEKSNTFFELSSYHYCEIFLHIFPHLVFYLVFFVEIFFTTKVFWSLYLLSLIGLLWSFSSAFIWLMTFYTNYQLKSLSEEYKWDSVIPFYNFLDCNLSEEKFTTLFVNFLEHRDKIATIYNRGVDLIGYQKFVQHRKAILYKNSIFLRLCLVLILLFYLSLFLIRLFWGDFFFFLALFGCFLPFSLLFVTSNITDKDNIQ